MKIKSFLTRIGLDNITPEISLCFLGKIQTACVLTIPYENIDILKEIPISLNEQDLYNKIVLNKRGGYCFELNGILHHMLSDMGFNVRSCFARYLRGETNIPFRRHRVVIAELNNEKYLLDIGVGQTAPRLPLKVTEGIIQKQGIEQYRFEKDEKLGWVLWDYHKGEWRKYISFDEDFQYDIDFMPASFWCEKHPDSPFNKEYMLAIKTEKGRITLDGREFKIFENDNLITKETLDTDEKLSQTLIKYFNIHIL